MSPACNRSPVMSPLTMTFAAAMLCAAAADREHKVHNIVLYPEKNSWCQTTPIKQIVASTGFEPTTIDNNVCVGACFSYSIPRTQPAEPGELIGPYCDSCQPSETMCYHVTLKKSEDKNSEQPRTIKKRVEIITNCSCMSCEKGQNKDCDIADQNTSELPTDLFSILHPNLPKSPSSEEAPPSPLPTQEIPDLIALNSRNRTADVRNETSIPEKNAKLVHLLRSIREEAEDESDADDNNFAYDKKELAYILEVVEKYRDELNETDLLDLVSFVNVQSSESLHMDLTRLKETLADFRKKKEMLEKHRKFGLGELAYGLPKTHYVGERQRAGFDSGHLQVGPRGSLILAPDAKKIHLDPEMLSPNHEGVVVSYEDHPAKGEED